MNPFEKQQKFEIQPIIEQRPFKDPAVQAFFAKWCEINDSIQPQFISHEDWRHRETKSMLEKKPGGKQVLYIPEDLRLWEMIGVIEAVDRDTFATKPEREDKAKNKLLELGKTFQNAGIYIAQRLNSIKRGQEIARALVEEFYDYGQWLIRGKGPIKLESVDDIAASHALTASEIATIDRFLAGDNLYESRMAKAEKLATADPNKRDELYEAERQKTLAQFFSAAEKAFELSRKDESGKLQENKANLKPWQNDTPIHSAFIAKVQKAITKKIEAPKRELVESIFRRGMEFLQKNMPFDKFPSSVKDSVLHWQNGETTLREALQIDRLKLELFFTRQSGNTAMIDAKERKIADKIQRAVSSFPYKSMANNPSEMVANQYINCTGASMLGGALMQEVGLNYLVGQTPGHSILFLVTSGGLVRWYDMLDASSNESLTNRMINIRKKDGSPLTVADIVAFSKNPTPEGLMLNLPKSKIGYAEKGEGQRVVIFGPEYGQQVQVLNNTGHVILKLGEIETSHEKKEGYYNQAVEAYRQAIAADSKDAYPHSGLGDAFYNLGHYEETINAYRQAIAIDPNYIHAYCGLGRAFYRLGRDKEAVKVCRKAITIDQKNAYPYYGLGQALSGLGHKEEAIEAYQKFIDLADKHKDSNRIAQAHKMIIELRELKNK